MELIAEGHHLLPWFAHPENEIPSDPEAFAFKYYRRALERAHDLKLPLTLIASQWRAACLPSPFSTFLLRRIRTS